MMTNNDKQKCNEITTPLLTNEPRGKKIQTPKTFKTISFQLIQPLEYIIFLIPSSKITQ